MSISSISGTGSLAALNASTNTTQKPVQIDPQQKTQGPSFGERVTGALDNLASAQNNASQAALNFELGKTNDLAEVMVEQQVASLGFQLTMQVRNKALTAYKDIMNMPV